MTKKPSRREKGVIAKALQQIAGKNKRLTNEDVIRAAENPAHPLHGHFTWDDTEAARKYRIIEAEELIRSVRVEILIDSIRMVVPVYVRDPSKGASEPGYIEISVLKKSPDAAHQALMYELNGAMARMQRARDLGVVLGFAGEIDGMLGNLVALCRRVGEVAA